jgi:hypothetical protein
VLLATYSAVKDHVPDAPDVENISTIITKRAKLIIERADEEERGRQFNRDLLKTLGISQE